ncbi:2,4-dienoyl-CoA reductase [(3E)-enoyl-CoA-producing], mitochondrial-like [Ornithodoros turicata]|uniref:2,4-dienoyl-CoA reductase [(3E)-enoyl-CoA-producing], mitochondrial-like n=1 Tax=Ornithodoros turicata TaxID=34597 RepID=UPI003138B999
MNSVRVACSSHKRLQRLFEGRRRYAKTKFPPVVTPLLPPGTFDNKVAFITGGGTGIGKGMAKMLAKLGANVAIVSRKQDVLDATAKEISDKTHRKILPVAADVRDPAAIAAAVDRCEQELGLPNIVINNAAGNFISPTEKLSPNAWKTIIDIVLNGTAFVTLEIGKRLIKADLGANFLAISATYTNFGSGFVAPSCAAKSGVEALTMSLASEWGRYGMRFNCISPGVVYTKGAHSRLDPEGMFTKTAIEGPIERAGEIAEVANLAAYLVSDYSNWLTGEVIRLDGGHLNYIASDFNKLVNIDEEKWEMLEAAIRNTKGS